MITIIGAGMAGLLAANMLRYQNPRVLEAQKTLPNNHHAVLRFRSDAVSEALGIPFRRVKMQKGYVPWRNPIADNVAYSYKVTGQYRNDRSILTAGIETHDRYIAPPDFIELMARRVSVALDAPISHIREFTGETAPIISTVPMPVLMRMLDYPHDCSDKFSYRHGKVYKAKIRNCFMHVTLYVPNPALSFNRISVTGDELTVEYFDESWTLEQVCGLLGVDAEHIYAVECKEQKYAKILPIAEDERKSFLHWATDKYGVYSLGRFATWRPNLLLDDLVKDIKIIDKLMDSKYNLSHYRATQ